MEICETRDSIAYRLVQGGRPGAPHGPAIGKAFKATYAEPMSPVGVKDLNHRATTIAGRPSSKKRVVVLRLLGSLQVSRELGKLNGTGLHKMSLTGYSTALAVVERASMYSAVQKFRLACRSVLLYNAARGSR